MNLPLASVASLLLALPLSLNEGYTWGALDPWDAGDLDFWVETSFASTFPVAEEDVDTDAGWMARKEPDSAWY